MININNKYIHKQLYSIIFCKRFRFYGEKEMQKFKALTKEYAMDNKVREVPHPRVMLMGQRGAGVRT